MKLHLLSKTEVWIRGITLSNANLGEIAGVVAELFGLAPNQVIVVDVGHDHVALDLLCEEVDSGRIIGRESELLRTLSLVKGVALAEGASVHSDGILGLMSVDAEAASRAVARASEMRRHIKSRLGRRAIVFPTGFEIERGLVEDTNTPWIVQRLLERGFSAHAGAVLPDDVELIAGALRKAACEGHGLAITTGGVGAEKKDCTVEAILRLDPRAPTRYTLRFAVGTGRHAKPGIRIAVGAYDGMTMVALPGPHDEVVAATGVLLECLDRGATRAQTASAIASALKARLRATRPASHHDREPRDPHSFER